MLTITNEKPYMTIMRLRALYPRLFYKQSWYKTEEFAHAPLPLGTITYNDDPPAVAVVWHLIYWWEDKSLEPPFGSLDGKYVWTSDRDAKGDQVYVGGHRGKHGLQIHRHLTITDKWVRNEAL